MLDSVSSPYALTGPSLVSNGYSAIPILPGSKRPGTMSRGRWYGDLDWTRFSTRLPTDIEVGVWNRYPDAGICVVLGGEHNVVAIDVDTEDGDEVEALSKIIPESPVAKRGAKGYTAFFRASPKIASRPFDTKRGRAVDLLCRGKQSVVPPTLHPGTGQPYVWLTDSTLEHISPDRLPMLPDDIAERVAEALRPFGYVPEPIRERGERTSFGGDIWDDVKAEALLRLDDWVPHLGIDAKRLRNGNWRGRAIWRQVENSNVSFSAKGIRDFGADEGITAIDVVMRALDVEDHEALDWLKGKLGFEDAPEAEPVEFLLKPRSAPDDGATDEEKQAAWLETAKSNFEKLPAEQRRAIEDMTRVYAKARIANGGEHPRYTEKVAAELGPQYREAFLKIDLDLFNLVEAKSTALQTIDGITVGKDADWTDVDGVLGEMRDWILATSPFPNRRMAVMAAFATLSGTTARHLYTPTGLGLGLVMAMLARTTVGKDAPLTAVAKILYAAGLGHMSQPAKSFTVSGFEQGLINSSGACVATGDEIGENLLARILSKKAMSHETMMKTFIMEATGQQDDSAPFALTKRSRNGSRDAAPIQTLDGILFTMLGASTPKRFFETLSNGNVTDGLLGRVLTINADPKPEENEAPFIRVPDSVIAALRAIGETGYTGKLNLGGMPIYDRVRAQWTPEGKARYDLLGKRIDALLATEPPYEELYGRAKANALVLATLLAISRDHIAPMVDAPDIDRGAAMVMESIAATIAGLGDATGGTPYGEMVRDIETYVRKRKTTTVRDIGNAVRGYSKKDRMAALTDMEELGRVTISRYDTNGMLSILPKSAVVWIA